MSKEYHDALQFAIANAESVDGVLNCEVAYVNDLDCWMLHCKRPSGETVSQLLSGQEVALEIIKELPNA